MTRIATMVAAGLMAGGLLLAPGVAGACEGHGSTAARTAPPEAKAAEPKKAEATVAPEAGDSTDRPLEALDSLMAAKCQCGSKADCTCKKGACECAKCKKAGRQVMDALRGRPAEIKLDASRNDATAGIFI